MEIWLLFKPKLKATLCNDQGYFIDWGIWTCDIWRDQKLINRLITKSLFPHSVHFKLALPQAAQLSLFLGGKVSNRGTSLRDLIKGAAMILK